MTLESEMCVLYLFEIHDVIKLNKKEKNMPKGVNTFEQPIKVLQLHLCLCVNTKCKFPISTFMFHTIFLFLFFTLNLLD